MAKVMLRMVNIANGSDSGVVRFSSSTQADYIDDIAARSRILSNRDQAFMQLYYRSGSTFSEMARVVGVNETTIARRVNKIIARLVKSEYATCLKIDSKLDGVDMSIAGDYFAKGLTQLDIAKKRGLTIYRVRKALSNIQTLIQLASGAA